MTKLLAILSIAAAALLVLTNSVYATPGSYTEESDAAQNQRFLRAAVVGTTDDVTSLLDNGLDDADEEGALIGKGSLSGHIPSADAGHDSKAPCRHDRRDKQKNTNNPKVDKRPSGASNGNHQHHTAASSSSGHNPAGVHAGLPSPPPSQHHTVGKGGNKHLGKDGGKATSEDALGHQHHEANVGCGDKVPVNSIKNAAHHQDQANGVVNKASKLGKNSSVSAGSADEYLTSAGSPPMSK